MVKRINREDTNKIIEMLKKYDIYEWQQLLELVEIARPPNNQPSDSVNWCADVLFDSSGGWKVSVFYDCGEIDSIDMFITPDGQKVDFWEWDDEHPWKNWLIAWRCVGDLHRLTDITLKEQQAKQ